MGINQKLRIQVGNVQIGDAMPCFLVAEIGLNHNGSMELAHKLVEAAALSGASMVKFQMRSPEDLATADFLDTPFAKCPQFGRTQREVRNRLELTVAQLHELHAHARELGLLFSTSVFDLRSLKAALKLDLPSIKIASHSITHAALLRAVAQTRMPVFASMGASSWKERDAAFEILKDSPLLLFHCVSAYPCPDSLVKLDTIGELRRRYGRVSGYSGHETGTDVSVGAAVLGAAAIERHLTLDRAMIGLDQGISLEPCEFAEMARRIRRLEKARGVADGIADEEAAARQNYHVAICAKRKIPAGTVLKASDLSYKQPLGRAGEGFTGLETALIIGKRTARELDRDRPIPREALR